MPYVNEVHFLNNKKPIKAESCYKGDKTKYATPNKQMLHILLQVIEQK